MRPDFIINLFISFLTVAAFIISYINYRRSGKMPSFFLTMAAIFYMIFIRAAVLLMPTFPDTEMVVGFWLILIASLVTRYLEYGKRT